MSAKGVNPNAKPFVPSFAQPAPQQQPPPAQQPPIYQQPPRQQSSSFAPSPYYHQPPQPYVPHQQHMYTQAGNVPPAYGRPMYPGLNMGQQYPQAPPQYPQAPPQGAPRASYDQILKSRGTPDSKVLTPSPESASPPLPTVCAEPSVPSPPLALLFLGPRGSGKSTQAKMASASLNLLFVSAGDLIRAKKHPFVELRRLIQQHFGPTSTSTYRGVSLDRFIVNGEADVYYLQWALGSLFSVPRVFLLMLDWEVALARADARPEENRVKSTQRRMMEYRAHFDACENIYAKVGTLDRVDCENYSLDAVHALIMTRLDVHFKSGKQHVAASALPPACLEKDLTTIRLISDFERFVGIKADVHHSVGSTNYEVAPVSSMSGVIDNQIIDDPRIRRPLSAYYATLKADGQRLVVVKHASGVVGFPQKFTGAYDLTGLFAAVQWPAKPKKDGGDSGGFLSRNDDSESVEWVMDCEVMRMPHKSHPTILAFDFIYFYGTRAVSERFSLRLKRLKEYFGQLTYAAPQAPRVFELKEYVPAGQLRKLLPDYAAAPFTVDGVVFQPDSNYRYGADKTMFKWKPQNKCTVDFRLYGCREPETKGGDWSFDAKAQEVRFEGEKAVSEEVTVPNVVVKIPHSAVIDEQLSDGAIVECVKNSMPTKTAPSKQQPTKETTKGGKTASPDPAPVVETWSYYKNRPDKLVPNRIDIVQKVSSMQHITYEQLLSVCDTFKSF